MKISLLLLFLLQGVLSIGDTDNSYSDLSYSLENVSTGEGIFVAIHPKNGHLFLYVKDNNQIIQFTESGSVDTLATVQFDQNFGKILDVPPNGNELLIWDAGLGRVHSLDLETFELSRLDESHNHMNQFGHGATVAENGNIYAMGGYGYWEFKNQLVFYSQEHRQWELLSKPDSEIVPSNIAGKLFRTKDTFLYINKPIESNTGHSYAYRYVPDDNRWVLDQSLTRMLSNALLDVERSSTYFNQTSTYAIDHSRNLIGLIRHTRSQSHYAYLIDFEENQMYELDLSQLNIYDIKNFFYVPGKDHWVILGHPFSTNRRDQLILRTFEFDLSHPALSVVQFQEDDGYKTTMILGSFGGLFLIILGWFFYRNILSSGSRDRSKHRAKSSPYIMEISKDGNEELAVYFDGKKFSHSGDVYLSRVFDVIYQMKQEGTSEMLISDLDQKLFSDNTHSSYKSRTRRKVIQVINSESDYEIIEEKKSQTDKRVKVIDVNLDKIKITHQDS
ncbi:MAG: hypothetical protein R6V22_06905 [Rhodohalobacter sp.]|uniref:hypothetical protein n=1 Tax=Rhodohalobacter sp. TaxID=1974210 RepID=UPI0039764395